MSQAWLLLCAIFNPLGGLGAVLRVVLDYLRDLDATLNDPDYVADLRHSPGNLRAVETAIVFAEHWIGILIAARTVELLGSRCRLDASWSGWRPASARSHESLMQRYQRVRASLHTIERIAMRRAARIRRMANASGPSVIETTFAQFVASPVLTPVLAMIPVIIAARIRAPP